jgi:tetratricopeptide (TPR) repeat protein
MSWQLKNWISGTAIAGAMLSVSCAHERRVTVSPAPAAPAASSVWDRQIRNAMDAGDGDYRLRVLRERSAAEPENVAVRMELAKAYVDRGYPDMALELCRMTAARFPGSGEAQLGLVRALRAMNRRQEAAEGLEAFLRSHPQTAAEFYSWLGILRDESGAWAAGEPSHRRAIELSAVVDYLHNNLGYNLLMQSKNEEAAAEFREALRLNPASQVARNNLGLALARQNAGAQAVANWQSAADPATAHNNLAAVWMEAGNYPEARKELQTALGYNRTHPAALRNLQLLGRLEGRPAILPELQESWWGRRKSGFKRLFVGPLEAPKAGKHESTTSSIHP